jgi:membrane protease YdiL (CAAX protease family)
METNMTLLDHGFVFIIAIIYPIVSFIGFRRLLRRVAAGEKVNRSDLYRNTFISHWTLFFIFIALWANSARPWSAIGISLEPDLWFAVGIALTVIGIAALIMQNRKVQAATPEELAKLRKSLDCVSIMIPQNGNELARFYGLSVTAGIVEEILWRGFLIWYLSQFMPVWAAALISAIGFGLAHAYQGFRQVPQITVVGAALAGLYLVSGSVWLPIVLHIAVDVLQGRMAYDVMYRTTLGESASGLEGLEANASSHR